MRCPRCLHLISDCLCDAASVTSNDPWIGRRINEQYEITSLIAYGGMGAVYQARHIHLGTKRAIKVIRSDIHINDGVYQRFKKEAQAISELSHSNIISFHDYGFVDSIPYVVMDLLEGDSLDQAIKSEGKLSTAAALEIFVQVASALNHAHNKGIFHRDIKPSNIMLTKDESGTTQAKVLDFGIAKIQNPDFAQRLTGTGEIFGSPCYMSPEQGKGLQVDSRSDIYSLGCVIFETLTGSPPFQGKSPIETIMKHLNEKPPRLTKNLNEVITDPVLADLEAIVERCLEKDPQSRYPTMQALEEDLKRLNYGERLLHLHQEMSTRRNLQLAARIYKYLLIAFAILLIPGAFLMVSFERSWDKRLQEALQQPDYAEELIQELFQELPKDQNYARNKAFLLWHQSQFLRLKSTGDPTLLQQSKQKLQEALTLAEKFKNTKTTTADGVTHHLQADCYESLARCYMLEQSTDSRKQGVRAAERAVELRRQSADSKTRNENSDYINLALSLELLAETLKNSGEYSRMEKLHDEAERLIRSYHTESWLLANCLEAHAETLDKLGKRDLARAKLKEALQNRLAIYDKNDPKVQILLKKLEQRP